jgi:hypothetical protein
LSCRASVAIFRSILLYPFWSGYSGLAILVWLFWSNYLAAALHQFDELRKQWRNIMRSGTRLRVALETEGRMFTMADALQRAVEQ